MPLKAILARSRRARLPVLLAGGLLASTLATAGGDRLIAAWAEHRTASAFEQATGTTTAPRVHIGGFPVTRQLLAGHLHRVDLHSGQIPAAGDRPVPISRLDLHMTDVHAYSDAHSAKAAEVDGSALLSYADLSDALGVQISADSTPGRIDATTQVPLLGDIRAVARPVAAGPTSIAFRDVQLDAHLPSDAHSIIVHALEQPVALQDLPAGLKLRRIRVDDQGVHGDLAGRNVTFRPQSTTNTTAQRA